MRSISLIHWSGTGIRKPWNTPVSKKVPDRCVLVVCYEVETVFQATYPLVSSQKNRAKSSLLKDFSPLFCRPLSNRGELHFELCATRIRECCRPLSKRGELHSEFRATRVRECCRPLSKRGELHSEFRATRVHEGCRPLSKRGELHSEFRATRVRECCRPLSKREELHRRGE